MIVGGGLAGLTLANRLTEDSHKQVLVLEAGQAHLNDPLAHANNNSFAWSRGKMLGGSTGISFLAFTRPAENEIDAIGALGNPGWTGENLFKYMRKAETFTPPDPAYAAANNLTFISRAHGTTGPLHDSFSRFICDAQKPWLTALETLGVHKIEDSLAGEDIGAFMAPSTIDDVSVTRSYAAPAYYVPVSNRSNLVVLTGAEVTQVVSLKTNETVEAIAVQFLMDEDTHVVSVKPGAEVILSAGTIKTPQILELSGIGDPQILSALGIPVKADLPGVGEGMIDQFFFGVSFAGALGEYAANKTGIMTLGVTAFALVPLQTIVGEARAESLIDAQARKIAAGNFSDAQKQKWDVIIQGLREPTKRGYIELAAFTGFFTTASPDILSTLVFLGKTDYGISGTPMEGKKYMTLTRHLRFPFSTGNIHAVSADPTTQPAIDPHYFEQDIDLEVMVDILKYLRKLGSKGGFKNLFASETDPGALVQTDEEIMQYIKNHGGTEFHTVGTAAMLPKEKGGVVSPELKVYGTSNIRVVDYSILPIQTSAHPMAALYGIAEKAPDIIRGIITV
ncbi:alcohol oxidase [Mycena metata]|uniref:Alcohol oxidase n=1 Tax=Mycena metata TaxID=1033252 RepID=A0AAD7MJK3_9AGAR|nr:alcohol oxidase [Mycena metata]